MKYSEAGVDIDRAETFKKEVKKLVRRTYNKSVLSDIGLFGGLYELDSENILVSTIDGVGTKTMVANLVNQHEVIGYDVVAHGSNDLVVQGAKPLFFLDYIGTSKLCNKTAIQLINGMVKACREVGCALIGGETAQMPGIYNEGEYDLAGCMIGVVNKKRLINGLRIKPGDMVVGLKSNGLHTNGYTLARKVLNLNDPKICKELLKPHKTYSKFILDLADKVDIKGLAHITGGGLIDNIPRILPKGTKVIINQSAWDIPPIFRLIQQSGNVPNDDMYRTFNMGIGMVIIVNKEDAHKISEGIIIGRIEASKDVFCTPCTYIMRGHKEELKYA